MKRRIFGQVGYLVVISACFALCRYLAEQSASWLQFDPRTLIFFKGFFSLLPWLIAGVLTARCLDVGAVSVSRAFLTLLNSLTAICLLFLCALPFIFFNLSPAAFFNPLPADTTLQTVWYTTNYLLFICAMVNTLNQISKRTKI